MAKDRLIFSSIGFVIGAAIGVGTTLIWHVRSERAYQIAKQDEIEELKKFYRERTSKIADERAEIRANDLVKDLIAKGYLVKGDNSLDKPEIVTEEGIQQAEELEREASGMTEPEPEPEPVRQVVYQSQNTVTKNFFDSHPGTEDDQKRPDGKPYRPYSRAAAKRDTQRELAEYDAHIAEHAAELEDAEIQAAEEAYQTGEPIDGPILISEQQFEEECPLYEKMICFVYLPSHIMCTEDGEIIENPVLYTGYTDPNLVFEFGSNFEEVFASGGFPATPIHTRNAVHQTDCRIFPSMKTYEQDVLGVVGDNQWPG